MTHGYCCAFEPLQTYVKIISVKPAYDARCTGQIRLNDNESLRSATTSSPESPRPNAKAGSARSKDSRSASPAPTTNSQATAARMARFPAGFELPEIEYTWDPDAINAYVARTD
jgi:hypothetical protein